MLVCNIGNAEAIFNKVDKSLCSRGIPWENLVSFVSDNCSVIVGKNNSVLTRIKERKPDVFDLGCVCHLANLCAVAGVKLLPLPVEDLLIDIYFHFHQSSKRKQTYKEFLEFCDAAPLEILKHVTTRWLSLQKCVLRILHHWPALQSYFQSHGDNEKEGRVKRVCCWLNSHEMKLHYYFLAFILGPLNEFNTAFQADSSKIGFLAAEMTRLLRKFLMKFVLARVIRQSEDIRQVDFNNSANQHTDEYIAVGSSARSYLHEISDDLDPVVKARFFRSVRNFYSAVVTKYLKKFTFDDPVLSFLDPDMKDTVTADRVVKIAERFPRLVSKDDFDNLEEEYQEYQASPESTLPRYQKDSDRIDEFWGEMSSLKNKITGKPLFPLQSRLALAMTIIPNSNADCERTFSMVKKIKTELRADLDNTTLCALLSCKINQDCLCYSFQPTKQMLNVAKSATYNCNAKNKLVLPSVSCSKDSTEL